MSPAPKLDPKQQEELVLKSAAVCIERTSLLDFKMADIANEAGLSMGSVYKHVQSKEDVLVALGVKTSEQHFRAFSEILSFPLTTPEKLMCIQLLTPDLLHSYSFGVQLEILISNDVILKRAGTHWKTRLFQIDESIEKLFDEMFHQSSERRIITSQD